MKTKESQNHLASRLDQLLLISTCIFLFVLPWREAIPVIGQISIGRILGVILFVLLFGRIVIGGIRRPTLFHGLLGGFIAWSAVSVLWAPDIATGAVNTARMGVSFVLAIAIWHAVNSNRRFEIVLGSLLAGSIVLLGFVGFEWVQTGIEDRGTMMFDFNAAIIGRRLAYCVPVAAYILSRTTRRDIQALATLFCLLVMPALLLMAVRQALITVIVGAFVFIVVELYDRHESFEMYEQAISKRVAGITGLIVFVGVGVIWVAYRQLGEFHSSYLTRFDGTLTGRTDIWQTGYTVFQEQANPLIGLGIGAFNSYIGPETPIRPPGEKVESNSAFVGTGIETGIVGLGLFLAAVFASLLALGQKRRDIAMMASAASIYLPLAIVADVHQDTVGWVLLTIVLVSCRLSSR